MWISEECGNRMTGVPMQTSILTALFTATCIGIAPGADRRASGARPRLFVPQDLQCTPGCGMVADYKRDAKGRRVLQRRQGERAPALVIRPLRWVMLTGVFPHLAQVAAYQDALKGRELPEYVGLECHRHRRKPDGTWTAWRQVSYELSYATNAERWPNPKEGVYEALTQGLPMLLRGTWTGADRRDVDRHNRLLVRFIDVTARPTHTYQYRIRVWFRNPNHGRRDLADPAAGRDEFITTQTSPETGEQGWSEPCAPVSPPEGPIGREGTWDSHRAVAHFSRVIARHPNSVGAYFCRAMARHDGNKDIDGTIADLTRTVSIDPKHARAYRYRGLAHSQKGDHVQAISDFSKAITLDPGDFAAYYNRARECEHTGQHDQAIRDYSKTIDLRPKLAAAYLCRARAHLGQARHDRAVADCSKAIALRPRWAGAYNDRGYAYDFAEHHDRAVADYTRAIALEPDIEEAYFNRARAYMSQGNDDGATADLTKAITLNPKRADAYLRRARLFLRIGKVPGALTDLDRALALDPKLALAQYHKGRAHMRADQPQEAVAAFRKFIELASPGDAYEVKEARGWMRSLGEGSP